MCTGCGGCKYEINVPDYVPTLIAIGIIAIITICTVVAIFLRERQMHKTFYGRIDHASTREENDEEMEREREAEDLVHGVNNEEMLVVTSVRAKAPLNQSPVAGIRVMMKKKRAHSKLGQPPSSNSPAPLTLVMAPSIVKSKPHSASRIVANIEFDSTGRGREVIECLNMEQCVLLFPGSRNSRDKLGELLVGAMQSLLQDMTTKHYIVCGFQPEKAVVMRGSDNLTANIEKQTLRLKLEVVSPVKIDLLAFELEAAAAKPIDDIPLILPPAPEKKDPPSILPESLTPVSNERVLPLSDNRRTPSQTPGPKMSKTNLGPKSILDQTRTRKPIAQLTPHAKSRSMERKPLILGVVGASGGGAKKARTTGTTGTPSAAREGLQKTQQQQHLKDLAASLHPNWTPGTRRVRNSGETIDQLTQSDKLPNFGGTERQQKGRKDEN